MRHNRVRDFGLVLVATCAALESGGCSDDTTAPSTTDSVADGAATGTQSPETDAGNPPTAFDPQVPPTHPLAMQAWLAAGYYKDWVCEKNATTKSDGAAAIHVHGAASRVCANILLAATPSAGLNSKFPAGAAAVKEVFDADEQLVGTFVEVKTKEDSEAGQGWYWYGSPDAQGQGFAMCTGCHSAAATDDEHPGAGDFVYHQQTNRAELPPIGDVTALEGWLQEGAYRDWDCEPEPSIKGEGAPGIHAHGRNRICVNQLLSSSASLAGQWPAGVAAVKELYDADDAVVGAALYLKVTSDSDNGNGFYWYEGASASGFGYAGCTGCHGAAGSDADHPGAGDYVYDRP